eukprot:TRINITY_DN13773_c0_g1_i2.p1 TRINITY_DN13773_c0_g1~~TRINITY_DN13773_c0_g1_i2.p1  ORF type:complete len:404 (-),score=28.49 TRINITY_DN13773_c0_g1_i2:8-1219(-)
MQTRLVVCTALIVAVLLACFFPQLFPSMGRGKIAATDLDALQTAGEGALTAEQVSSTSPLAETQNTSSSETVLSPAARERPQFNFTFSHACTSFVTCQPDLQGLGHAQANRNYGLLVAGLLGEEGVCFANPMLSDWRRHIHFESDQMRKATLLGWDRFLGIGKAFHPLKKVRMLRLPLVAMPRKLSVTNAAEFIRGNMTRRALYLLAEHSDTHDHCPTATVWRAAYWKHRSRSPAVEPLWNITQGERVLRVVLHLRRGDVFTPSEKSSRRILPTEFFLKVATTIQRLTKGKIPTEFHVVSQGSAGILHRLTSHLEKMLPFAFLHINTDAHRTFHSFVLADVLVMDRSRFSHFAGMVSTNPKIATRFRYSVECDSSWVVADPDSAEFDTQQLLSALRDKFDQLS